MRRMKALALNLLLTFSAMLISLAALEVGLRVFSVEAPHNDESRRLIATTPIFHKSDLPGNLKLMTPNMDWGYAYPDNPRGYFNDDNTVMFHTNSAGFRDDEFSMEKDPAIIRIALLGDSFAHGDGVYLQDTAATLLEAYLNEQTGCTVEVYNFATPDSSSTDQYQLLQYHVLDYHPDMIVIWYFLNDVEVKGTMYFLGAGMPVHDYFPHLRRYSVLADLAGTWLETRERTAGLIETYQAAYMPTDQRWMTARESLQGMARTAHEAGIPIVLTVHPILYHLGKGYPFAAIHEQVIATAEAAGFTAFDLRPAFAGYSGPELWVHRVDQHPNETAHRLAAQYMADKLVPLLPQCVP